MTLEEIATALNSAGDLNGSEGTVVSSVQTDSRLVRPKDLFFCLAGQTMDGHNFADQAADNGASAIVSHHPMPGFRIPVLLVQDTLKALGRLARYWRLKKGNQVIAVTGSAGKTTTKEMLAHVLDRKGSVGKNYKNWNNQIGLPLSILRFSGDEEFWVLELGINNPLDMDELGEIARPDMAVILNVGPCHLQGLGSIEGVAESKGKILDHLQGPGKAFVCADYPHLIKEVQARAHVVPVWFSCNRGPADYILEYQSSGSFIINSHGRRFILESPPGWSQYCENIGAVWSVAENLGLSPDLITAGLSEYRAHDQRFCMQEHGDWTIIDDSYNANPLSMSRAIDAARSLAGDRNLFLVLGNMAELGTSEAKFHQDLGSHVSETGCRAVFFHGNNARNIQKMLNPAMKSCFHQVHHPGQFQAILDRLGYRGGVVLFKGSRNTAMERYVACFKEWASKR